MSIDDQMKEAHKIEISVNDNKTWYNLAEGFD